MSESLVPSNGDISPTAAGAPATACEAHVSFSEALRTWCRVALLSFGGPAGQIAVMHRILVDEKKWIHEERFLHALNYCMLLPGPEAQQLAIYIGWLLHRTIGGLVAGILFVLPGAVAILILSILYACYQETSLVQGLFYGLKPAVLAVVVEAVFRIGRRVLKNRTMLAVAAIAFLGIFLLEVPFPVIVLAAGLTGYVGGRLLPGHFITVQPHGPSSHTDSAAPPIHYWSDHLQPTLGRAVKVVVVGLVLWFSPLLLLAVILGTRNVFMDEGLFFSKAAVVTFGGAYAVLAYVAQQAVDRFEWLKPGEMLDGLGMAETTPGPLIMVVQFVGFMGAYRHPGELPPLLAGVFGSLLTTWVTFVPCFIWIFLGAPYVERLRHHRPLSAALSTITAAVVGVILNLAVWFALHVLFSQVVERHLESVPRLRMLVPVWNTLDPAALAIATGAFAALFYFKRGMLVTLGCAAVAGMLLYWLA